MVDDDPNAPVVMSAAVHVHVLPDFDFDFDSYFDSYLGAVCPWSL